MATSIASAARWALAWTEVMIAPISLVAAADFSASLRTSLATTAKPLP